MNRPMAVIGFSLFFTLIAVGLLGYFVAFWLLIALGAGLLVSVLIFRRRLPLAFVTIMLSAMVACGSFCAYSALVYDRVVSYAGAELPLKLEITEIEGEDNGTYHYVAEITQAEHRALIGAKVRIASPSDFGVQVCDLVTTTATINEAGYGEQNKLYYKSSGIFLSVYIADGCMVEKNPDKSWGFYFYEIRQAISGLISANLNEESAAVVNSIFLGNTSELDYKDSMNFRNVGISHIFCVSGLHVALISVAIHKFLSVLIRRKKVLYGATIFSIWLFVAVTGFPYSSIRSAVMLSIYYLGKIVLRNSDSLNSLGAAVTVLCILNPFSANNISLLYSFFATLAMLVMPRPRLERVKSRAIRAAIETAVVSVNVMVFTLPIQIFFFGTATLASPLANVLVFFALPPLMVCTMIAVVLSLFTSVLSSLSFLVCAVISKYLIFVADLLSEIPYATMGVDRGFVKVFVVAAILTFLLIAYFRLGKRANIAAIFICAAALTSGVITYNLLFKPVMTVAVIDSGSATSVVVTQGRRAVVIGCGGSKYTASDVDYLLRQRSVREVDLLLLPSRDNADAMNVDGLVERINVNSVISGEDYGLLYSLDIGGFSISQTGQYRVGEMCVSYAYTENDRLTYLEMGDSSILVVSAVSDGYELNDEWRNADVVICVGKSYRTNNERINVLCTNNRSDYPMTTVCYKGGGNIVMEFLENGIINCERRA